MKDKKTVLIIEKDKQLKSVLSIIMESQDLNIMICDEAKNAIKILPRDIEIDFLLVRNDEEEAVFLGHAKGILNKHPIVLKSFTDKTPGLIDLKALLLAI